MDIAAARRRRRQLAWRPWRYGVGGSSTQNPASFSHYGAGGVPWYTRGGDPYPVYGQNPLRIPPRWNTDTWAYPNNEYVYDLWNQPIPEGYQPVAQKIYQDYMAGKDQTTQWGTNKGISGGNPDSQQWRYWHGNQWREDLHGEAQLVAFAQYIATWLIGGGFLRRPPRNMVQFRGFGPYRPHNI